jgi:hypothetical protein
MTPGAGQEVRHDRPVSDDQLTDWTFSVEETSPGVYKVEGVDSRGRSVGTAGSDDLDWLLAKTRELARDIDKYVSDADQSA